MIKSELNFRHFLLQGIFVYASAVLLAASCPYEAHAETSEEEYAVVNSPIISSPGTPKPIAVINSGALSYITSDEFEKEVNEAAARADAAAESGSDDGIVSYTSNADATSMEVFLSIYDAPGVTLNSSSGNWTEDYDSESGKLWRFVAGDGTTLARGGWAYIYDEDASLTRKGSWYCFDDEGYAVSGWVKNGDDWYYTESDGETPPTLKTGWHLDENDGYAYYLDDYTGKMLTGWQKIDGFWYYFTALSDVEADTWAFDESTGQWIYTRTASHPYGSMYRSEASPDGWMIDHVGRAVE